MDKLSRKACVKSYPCLPVLSEEKPIKPVFPTCLKSIVLSTLSIDFDERIKEISEALVTLLIDVMKKDRFIFMGMEDNAWFGKRTLEGNALLAKNYLVVKNIGVRFMGGLVVGKQEITTFIPHLAHLIRVNGLVPQVYFTDPKQYLLFNICQYGNLHVDCLTEEGVALISNLVEKTNLLIVEGVSCTSN
jgi:hypothetical protein